MAEKTELQLRDIVDIFLRYKRWIIILTMAITIIMFLYIFLMPRKYTASFSIDTISGWDRGAYLLYKEQFYSDDAFDQLASLIPDDDAEFKQEFIKKFVEQEKDRHNVFELEPNPNIFEDFRIQDKIRLINITITYPDQQWIEKIIPILSQHTKYQLSKIQFQSTVQNNIQQNYSTQSKLINDNEDLFVKQQFASLYLESLKNIPENDQPDPSLFPDFFDQNIQVSNQSIPEVENLFKYNTLPVSVQKSIFRTMSSSIEAKLNASQEHHNILQYKMDVEKEIINVGYQDLTQIMNHLEELLQRKSKENTLQISPSSVAMTNKQLIILYKSTINQILSRTMQINTKPTIHPVGKGTVSITILALIISFLVLNIFFILKELLSRARRSGEA